MKNQFFAFFTAMMARNQNELKIDDESKKWVALDQAFHTPPFQIPNIPDNEKLFGRTNYKGRKKMIELDLGTFNLLHFINTENGGDIMNILPAKRKVLNAQALQYLKRSVLKHIAHSL